MFENFDISAASDDELKAAQETLKNLVGSLNNKQAAMKVTLNSAYGALASEYFRWFDIRLAEGITVSGQTLIQWVERDLNNWMNKILGREDEKDFCIAIDTDSLMFDFGPFVKKFAGEGKSKVEITQFLDKAYKGKIKSVIEKSVQDFCDRCGIKNNRLGFERDVIADRALYMVKKRYILQMRDAEGVPYPEGELKIVGTQAVRTDTPEIVRDEIKKCYKIALNQTNDDLIKHIAEFRKKFNESPPEVIAFPRGISELSKFVLPNGNLNTDGMVPGHVMAAWRYNDTLKRLNLLNKYTEIKDGDKFKFIHLKTPNPLHVEKIGFIDKLPEEFGVHKFIDYETQFQKTFLHPLTDTVAAMGWVTERTNDLEEFF